MRRTAFRHYPVLACGTLLLAAGPALAQGTAPTQGVTRPSPPPAAEAPPPAPSQLGDGEPRRDTGGGATRTTPDSTAQTPLPPPGQAEPPPRR
ncbi:hypothetical protein GCM10011504_05730 [Siccirubricoccus deserti]|uniref:Uncharacterized protein n=1 Tax=Siccirubricoccus deserti TaxID=2013562 RepID=A0A9X0QWJ0_9PROT|nr:hypothetical protein [Siccirubricoccus deserti]MBC4013892.1 hypothetical protein [Siccirubricoccus deserti]GGC30360.1 hypothetical protein GCM10011504_05730 [Siccirubricoccus deserti]